MSLRALSRLLGGYAVLLLFACLGLRRYAAVRELPPAERRVVDSVWTDGKRTARALPGPSASPAAASLRAPAGSTLVRETVTASGPLSLSPLPFAFGLVPGKDGVMAELDGRTAFATVDDLLAAQAYDRATTLLDPGLEVGTHRAVVVHLLALDLGVTPAEVEQRARLRRVRFERTAVGEPAGARITRASLAPATVREALHAAAAHLARGVDQGGRFRYQVDATTDQSFGPYSWPRHAGTTYFLAQAAALTDDPAIRAASLRAAARLRDELLVACGASLCVAADGDVGDVGDVGASALALIAFAELVQTGADASYRPAVVGLARFLRAQQRPDGELMHLFDRRRGEPVDVQHLFSTGEAALALSRAHRVTGNPEDLSAAARALAHLAGPGWSFFGSRYYFGEEHWTCQAASDLWDRAPDRAALAFCLRWDAYQRSLQHRDGETPFDADGAFGFGPLVTPRTAPAACRGEAAAATLSVLRRDPTTGGASPAERARTREMVDDELRRALAFVLRAQLHPGPTHLFARPDQVRGGVPGSEVDLRLRIDYAQHAGSLMARWLTLPEEPPAL